MILRRVGVLGALVVLVGACGGGANPALTQRGSPPASPTESAKTCPGLAGLPAGANDHGAATAPGPAGAIEAGDTFFSPTCLTGILPGKFTLTVRSSGSALHNISVKEQSIDIDVEPGKTVTVQIQVATTPVVLFCKYHRSSGMVGSLLPARLGRLQP